MNRPPELTLVVFPNMANKLPFVQAACICEKVIQDKDDIFSLIRIVDTYYLQPIKDVPEGAVGAIELSVFVSVKSGDLNGSYEMSLALRNPIGEVKKLTEKPLPVVLTGGEHGFNLNVHFMLEVKRFGLFWFDVIWGDELLTSIPLKLVLGERPK